MAVKHSGGHGKRMDEQLTTTHMNTVGATTSIMMMSMRQ